MSNSSTAAHPQDPDRSPLSPLLLDPVLVERIWGGARLASLLG